MSSAPFPPGFARLNGVPDLPPHYLPREADLAGLKRKLLAGGASVGIIGQSSAVGVQGMGRHRQDRAGRRPSPRFGGAAGVSWWHLLVNDRSKTQRPRASGSISPAIGRLRL
jgi:hypothetical protein